ncbi:TetR family transcriptional regulator [Streptomyces eurocidicus]|uniref:AcrR family transcriptional regulator n=1 Tax=Streptomyces eurocidicus TaxID=66423 RepID=A0A2N8P0G1_STREU|nr:TetR/AcrR family transcriptional regulator [Streptomyces eurocidicus]MBB5121655.1 AcrR family transcriptional regulator [Streptomyces eurocidicus]MBF6052883.1 TetR family transcriptional regulator [Streptomyces eurocidicus]PNE34510.1 TetR family transcriptional regulator [Streptomyces eurocidicus]
MTGTGTTGRRARLRAETTAEIKSVALGLMASGGPGAITLRAIAREMGMTANAIYGYFATRDELVTTLIDDVYTSLADAAGDTDPAAAPADRIRVWAHAFRGWALANPEGFRLIYGDPVPGYQAPEGGAAPDAAHRVCASLTALAAAAWPRAERLYADSDFQWSDFDPALLDKVRPAFPGLPPAGVALALRIWGHLHGLVTLEIYGHLHTQTTNPDKLFRDELTQLIRSLDLTPES